MYLPTLLYYYVPAHTMIFKELKLLGKLKFYKFHVMIVFHHCSMSSFGFDVKRDFETGR
jgi:hypothetical protein